MTSRRFPNPGIPASRLGKLREYLNSGPSQSRGDAWGHKVWSYKLYYPGEEVPCGSFDDVLEVVKTRGETTAHMSYFESRTGRKLKVDTTNAEAVLIEVENGRFTDSTLERVRVLMAIGNFVGRVFVTHGRSALWREVGAFIEKECNPTLETLELATRPGRGRTIIEKLEQESRHCSYAVVVMTGDDETADGETRARENVIHEIGYFQGRYGRSRVCLLHGEGSL